jgi:transcriptional regulator with XRE-family HTH domain
MTRQLDPDRSLWDLIAVELQRQREAHGLSGNKLAGLIGVDRSTVSRVENGLRRLSTDVAKKIDDLWDTKSLFERLVRLADSAEDGGWFKGLVDYEGRATRHRMWQALVVPGLLQTPDYARTVIAAASTDVEKGLKTRLERQAGVFDRTPEPYLAVMLNWTVLHQVVGGRKVMKEQLAHLLALSEKPNVSIRVVEQGEDYHVGLDGSFRLLTVEDRDIAFSESPSRGRLVLDPTGVQDYALRHDRISSIATPTGPSRGLIKRLMEAL